MESQAIHIDELLTTRQVAERVRARGLRCVEGTLDNHASRKSGPIFRLVQGRRYYHAADVDAWIASLIGRPVRSASEARRSHEVAA